VSGIGALTVFVLGMRHGADPDHLAAIDNVTRGAREHKPKLSRFTGVFFAIGHSAMVLALATLFSIVATELTRKVEWLENAGTFFSIAILLAMATINIAALRRNESAPVGVKTRMLPRALRNTRNPLVAIPIGLLFGLGFETSSQLAAYGMALSHGGGAIMGVFVGIAFCAGLVVTDALDGFLVHYIVMHRTNALPSIARMWLWVVTVFAVLVAGYEAAPFVGFVPNERTDLVFGLTMVALLVLTFAAVVIGIRRHQKRCA
jgi:nickel/cobalt transporter (NiCoT) family protein